MKLNETLHNCLTAVANRYPQYIVDVDEDLWGDESVKLDGETTRELLEQLQAADPQYLYVPAHVECDTYKCELSVVDLSQERPVFRFHFPRVLTTHP